MVPLRPWPAADSHRPVGSEGCQAASSSGALSPVLSSSSVLLTSAPDSKIPPSAPHFRTAGEIERTERSTPSSSFILFFPVCSRCLSAAAQDGVEETVCVSVLRLWQAVCSENGEPGFGSSPRSLREPHGTREAPEAGPWSPASRPSLRKSPWARNKACAQLRLRHPHSRLHRGQGHCQRHEWSRHLGTRPALCRLVTSAHVLAVGWQSSSCPTCLNIWCEHGTQLAS